VQVTVTAGSISFSLPGILDSGSEETLMNVDDIRELFRVRLPRSGTARVETAGGGAEAWVTRLTLEMWGKLMGTTVKLTAGMPRGLVILGLVPTFQEFLVGFNHPLAEVSYEPL
jgi:hypothetical protein